MNHIICDPRLSEPLRSNNMSRTFAYCRVSTEEQTTENQVLAISNAGYDIEPSRIVEENISGSTKAFNREAFNQLINVRMESGDTLVVLKLDRLGRDNIDVQQTVNYIIDRGIHLTCLDLPVPNISSSEGQLMLQMFSAFAEFERNRIIERTKQGLARVKAEGKQLGRPPATATRDRVQVAKQKGMGKSEASRDLELSLSTVKRHWT